MTRPLSARLDRGTRETLETIAEAMDADGNKITRTAVYHFVKELTWHRWEPTFYADLAQKIAEVPRCAQNDV